MKRKTVRFLASLLAAGCLHCVWPVTAPVRGEENGDAAPTIVQLAIECLTDQEDTDRMILSELNSGEYTFDQPLVLQDPYEMSPLTALLLFQTEQPSQISIHIPGKTGLADVDFTFDGFNTNHTIPIYGLYSGTLNPVELTAREMDGSESLVTIAITTVGLPTKLKLRNYITYLADEALYQPGMNFSYDAGASIRTKTAFDANGEYRWYLDNFTKGSLLSATKLAANYNGAQSIWFSVGSYHQGDVLFLEMNLLGKILRVCYSPNGCHHEIELTGHDTMIVSGANPKTPDTNQDLYYEIDLLTGETLHELDYKQVLLRTRNFGTNYKSSDWCHTNSAVEYQGDIIVSSNFQSTVLRNDWGGTIKWMLCDRTGYTAKYWPCILTPIGEDFEYPYNQHAIEILPDTDNNPDTLDIILFDNGTSRNIVNKALQEQIKLGKAVEPDLYSRMVIYRINEKMMTVEQLWEYGSTRPELFSRYRGDADVQKNGNILGCFITGNDYFVVYTEVTPEKDVVWECVFSSPTEENKFIDYRVERLPLYTETANDLHIGEKARNLIPANVLKANGITPAQAGPEAPETAESEAQKPGLSWQLNANRFEIRDGLYTVTDIPQYEGDILSVNFDNTPTNGMEYLLAELTIANAAARGGGFPRGSLDVILADGTSFSRLADDGFLTDHGYDRLPATDQMLGSSKGWVVFEIPSGADLDGAFLRCIAGDVEYTGILQ